MIYRYLSIGLLLLAGLLCVSFSDCIAKENYLWLTVGDLTKEKEGTINRYFMIKTGHPSAPKNISVENIQAFYRIYPVSRYSEPTNAAQWRACTIQERHQAPAVRIQSQEYGMAQVFVTGIINGKRCFAQADVFIFPVRNRFEKIAHGGEEKAPAWPDTYPVAMVETPNYWPQTGRELTFRWESIDSSVSALQVIEGGTPTAILPVSDMYTYTPLDDPQLNRLGPRAWKNIVFITLSGDASYAFTTVVHRSRTNHLQLLPGIGVVFLAAILTFGGVLLIRRRGRRL